MIMNMPTVEDKNLLWNISDEIYRELTELDIPMPSNLGSYIFNIFYYDEKIYLVGSVYSTDFLTLFIYENGEWTSKTFWSEKVTSANVTMEELNGDIYIALNYSSSPYGFLKKYSNSNKTLTTITDKSTSYSFALAKDIEKNILYIARLANGSSQNLAIATHNGATLSNYTTTSGKFDSACITSAFLHKDILNINMKNGYLYLCDVSKGVSSDMYINANGQVGIITSVCTNKNKKYMTISSRLNMYNNYSVKLLDIEETWLTSYKDSLLTIMNTSRYAKVFYELKLYKIATTYAPKGTKIYLTDNSFAISDNLEPTDNGYIVTADGEVKIGIYE